MVAETKVRAEKTAAGQGRCMEAERDRSAQGKFALQRLADGRRGNAAIAERLGKFFSEAVKREDALGLNKLDEAEE